VEFDELWAREGAKPPDAEADAAESAEAPAADGQRSKVGQRSAA
jgi:hypothetical protein